MKIVTDPSFKAGPHTTMQDTPDAWSHMIVADIDRVKQELLDADTANLVGYDMAKLAPRAKCEVLEDTPSASLP